MATYNCAPTLRDALDSIEKQTLAGWELIVCDDASTDGSLAILEEFAMRHPGQVTVLRNETNQKLAYSLNRCLAECSGEFIARMDGDDRSYPERLEIQRHFLVEHPRVQVVGTAMRRFDDKGEHDVVRFPRSPDRWALRELRAPFAHATIMMRRATYEALGGYTVAPRTRRGQDLDLWFRFFHEGYVGANIQEPLYWVREDIAAIRRRGFKTRWMAFQTTIIGFRMLDYPVHWYARPVFELAKALIPPKVMLIYRRWQARNN